MPFTKSNETIVKTFVFCSVPWISFPFYSVEVILGKKWPQAPASIGLRPEP